MQVCYTHPGLASMMLKNPGDYEYMLHLPLSFHVMPVSYLSRLVMKNHLFYVASILFLPTPSHILTAATLSGAEHVRVSLIHLLVQQGSIQNSLQRTWLRYIQVVTSHITQAAVSTKSSFAIHRTCLVVPIFP